MNGAPMTMPVGPQAAMPRGRQQSAVQTFGALVLSFYLICVYSRVLDPLMPSAHLPAILSLIMLLLIMASGGVTELVSAPLVRRMGIFTLWLFATLPTSYWRGGSVTAIQTKWLPAVIPMLALGGLGLSLRQIMSVLRVLFFAGVFTAVIAWATPNYVDGRLSGTLGNPNDFAAVLVMALALAYFIFSSAPPGIKRVLMFPLMAPILLDLALTGSRGGLLAAVVLGWAIFKRMPAKGRVAMVAIVLVGVSVAGVTLQRSLVLRYQSFFAPDDVSDEEDAAVQEEYTAVASTSAREQLLKDSLWMTLYHPIFGVGIGNFMPAAAEFQKSEHRRAMWHATHNTFTEISSELGIPGFIIFMSAIVGSWRVLGRIRRTEYAHPLNRDIRNAANAVQFALLSYCVSAAFASVGYGYQLPLIVGLTVALANGVAAECTPVTAAPGAVLEQAPRLLPHRAAVMKT